MTNFLLAVYFWYIVNEKRQASLNFVDNLVHVLLASVFTLLFVYHLFTK